jgi:1-acyl-sn-glycerol-3-phosphate acyltransferase
MIRVILIGTAFLTLTLLLLPFQLIGLTFRSPIKRVIPHWYNRTLCAVIGIRVRQIGQRSPEFPLLILANHASWLDIVVITSLTPAVFIAKKEVATWPLFGWLAKLQRSVFIDRERRHKTGAATKQIADRLLGGDAVVLFAEGTSGDGNRTLPFRSALIGAVHHTLARSTHHDAVTVQPLSLAYVGLSGMPISRASRERVSWYGDIDLIPHLIGVLRSGAIDVVANWGEPVAYGVDADRKEIARNAELAVRRMTASALRSAPPANPPDDEIEGVPASI